MLVGRLAPRLPGFLRRALSLRSTFLEIGAGDCALARCAAGHVERAYAALGPHHHLAGAARAPNLVPVLSDGVLIPVPEASVDAALSERLIERLHPRDVLEHLQSVRRALRRGGRYFCITSHRCRGLRELFIEAGFREVRFHSRICGLHAEVPYWMLRAVEAFLGILPCGLRAEALK